MIDKFCTFLTNKIRKEMPEIDDERAEIIMYGLQNIIGEMPKGIIILLIAYLLGLFKLTLLAVLFIAPYRCVSGGVHMKTHLGCIIYTLILYSGTALIGKYVVLTGMIKYVTAFIIWIFCMIMIKLYAPADTENVPILRKKERLQKLYEKARHNLSWKNPDGIASSDGRSKNSMKSIIARGKRMEFEADSFTEIPDREVGIIIYFDKRVSVPAQKRILSYSLKELRNNERILSKNIFLNVVGNEHICIIGQNGAGKSTLLKKLYNELKDRSDINVGYMPQNYADVIDYSMSPTEFFQSCFDKESCTKALTYMGNMKFTADEMFHPIGELSGGQIAKILFLDMVLRKCNVLLLDEPTRNFSPLSAPVIRNALINFNGTIISISHDRKYLDEVADTIYILNETGLQKI